MSCENCFKAWEALKIAEQQMEYVASAVLELPLSVRPHSVNSSLIAVREALAQIEVVHQCPPNGESVTPCCGVTPFELPRNHRIACDASLVTCKGGRR